MDLPEITASLVCMVLGSIVKPCLKTASFDINIPPIRPQESEAAVFSLMLA